MDEAPRVTLRRAVNLAAASATTAEEFFAGLEAAGITVRQRYSTTNPGQVTGYAVALDGDVHKDGKPVWYSGGKLAADLTWPKLALRWHPARQVTGIELTDAERAALFDQAAKSAENATELIRAFGATSPWAAADAAQAAADTLHVAAAMLHSRPLRQAAGFYERAAREPFGRIPRPTKAGNQLRQAARVMAAYARISGDRTNEWAFSAASVWRYWHQPPPSTPEDLATDRVALIQIMGTLTPQQAHTLITLARHGGDHEAAATALGVTAHLFTQRLTRARLAFLSAWHEHETVPRRRHQGERRPGRRASAMRSQPASPDDAARTLTDIRQAFGGKAGSMTAVPDIDDAALQARAREDLHQAAAEAWQAIARRQPAPDLDPEELFQALHLLFAPGTRITPVEQLIEDWYELACQSGINLTDENGEVRPGIDEAITRTVTAAIWFGITTGHHAIAGGVHFVPRKLSGWA